MWLFKLQFRILAPLTYSPQSVTIEDAIVVVLMPADIANWNLRSQNAPRALRHTRKGRNATYDACPISSGKGPGSLTRCGEVCLRHESKPQNRKHESKPQNGKRSEHLRVPCQAYFCAGLLNIRSICALRNNSGRESRKSLKAHANRFSTWSLILVRPFWTPIFCSRTLPDV